MGDPQRKDSSSSAALLGWLTLAVTVVSAAVAIYVAFPECFGGSSNRKEMVQNAIPCKTEQQGTILHLCKGDIWPPKGDAFQLELVGVLREGPVTRALLQVRDGVSDGRPRSYTHSEYVSLSTRAGGRLLRVVTISDRPEFVDIDIGPLQR